MSDLNPTGLQNTLDLPDYQIPSSASELEDRFKAAFLLSAIGDALGWPTEFLDRDHLGKVPFELPLRDFVAWEKRVGGLWWGYQDKIGPGEYSDDTQLGLALARSIDGIGGLQPERFAYFELPLWLHYERGGGRSVKAAARSLIGPRAAWNRNFYRRPGLDYRSAGANGSAMRNLPIALVNLGYEDRTITDSFVNTIITHGHPNAILGSILFALTVRHVLSRPGDDVRGFLEYLTAALRRSWSVLSQDSRVRRWIGDWDNPRKPPAQKFESLYLESLQRALTYLAMIPEFLQKPAEDYYHLVGALDKRTKGSGTGTVAAALFLFLKERTDAAAAMETAVNVLGSDTDTISSFLGAMLGADSGMKAIPSRFASKIQDKEYILTTAQEIHAIASDSRVNKVPWRGPIQKHEAYLKMLAWEIGLHEMFWDAIDVGDTVVHPSLGRGTIKVKLVEPMARANYAAKLMHVQFDIGQTCVFHSRMKDSTEVSNSLGKELDRGLTSTTATKPTDAP